MIGQTLSHYRIVRELGKGGMGVVYLAEDTVLGRSVAIKTLTDTTGPGNQHFRGRFLREARAVSALSHPNIATIHDYGETTEGQPYIVMEFVKGETLSELIQEGSLTLKRAIEIIVEVAEALAEAHRHGIIHRDIKPSNIAINEHGDVKVLDFGLAKHLDEAAVAEQLGNTSISQDGLLDGHRDAHSAAQPQVLPATRTREGAILCTPEYASPEQAMGLEVDARTDLFSLGSVLYECATGTRPFSGPNPNAVRAEVISDNPPPPSTLNSLIPSELDRITLKALAKKPDARYQTAHEMIANLQSVNAELQSQNPKRTVARMISPARSTNPDGPLQTLSDLFKHRRRSVAYLALFVLALLVVFGSWQFLRAKTYQPSPTALGFYEQGTVALAEGAYHNAIHAFGEAIRADDKYSLAYAREAETWAELDNDDKAKEAIARANVLALSDSSRLEPLDSLYLQAISATVLGTPTVAIEKYQEIARKVPASKRVSVDIDLGRAYEKNDEPGKAIETYLNAANTAPNALALMKLGVLYGRQQKLHEAIETLKKSEDLYRSANNDEGITEVLIQRGVFFDNLDKSSDASEQLRAAFELSRRTGNKPQQVRTLLQWGSVLNTERKPEAAEQYINDAIDIAHAEGMEDLATRGLLDLGNVFFLNGKYDQAEDYFKECIKNSSKHNGLRSASRALLSLGSLRMQQGKTDSAINYIEQALSFYQERSYRKETSQALLLLGRVHDYRGDYDAAQSTLAQELQVAQETGDQSQEARSHMELGSSLYHQEKYVEALTHFRECYRLDASLNNQSQLGYDLLNRGIVYQQLGLSREAREVYAQITREYGANNKQLQAWVHVSSARLALSEEDYRTAKAESLLAISGAGKQFRDITVHGKYLLGLSDALSGTPRTGIAWCKEAVDSALLTGDPRLISYARLAFAEALLLSGNGPEALTHASEAQRSFSRSGQRDSEWRALVIEALAGRRIGEIARAKEQASHALDLISQIEKDWGKETADRYFSRPDIKRYRGYLNTLVALS